ncbi:MAG: RdgB/HAM1 family non-canonical purine NTP pyrophosphatase [Nitrosopumilaceae archaeon]|nr:RdgB/HAM1 family non-canonical purine NTP pyrophosphatase [Nitrosopumilaceae archaeon]
MQEWNDVYFVSSNKHKYTEVKKILSSFGIQAGFFQASLTEIQSNSLAEIARIKALDAFSKCKKPIIIEDDALIVESLGGFPGPYSSYVFDTIGNKGVVSLTKKNRNAKFCATISYCDRKKKPILFEGITPGKIAKKISNGGWGYDPIFIPQGKTKTYAQIPDKNTLSHRYKALEKFASWFVRTQR